MSSDAGLFLRILPRAGESRSEHWPNEPTSHLGPDLMAHINQVPWAKHPGRLGFDVPAHASCVTLHITSPVARVEASLVCKAQAQTGRISPCWIAFLEDEQGTVPTFLCR
ncbi:hypothetical protein CF336_g8814 [Tilletia laevis]|nr:hypothetical protein CF336_g8814 [Tilletia laevis]